MDDLISSVADIKSFDDIYTFDEIATIKEKLSKIERLSNELKLIDLSSISENNIEKEQEIFFSLKHIQNIKIHKLLSKGKFGKV